MASELCKNLERLPVSVRKAALALGPEAVERLAEWCERRTAEMLAEKLAALKVLGDVSSVIVSAELREATPMPEVNPDEN